MKKSLLFILLLNSCFLFPQVKIVSSIQTRDSVGRISKEEIRYQHCKVNWSKSTWSRGSALFLYEAPSSKFVQADFLVKSLSCGVSISWNTVNESLKMSDGESQEYIFIKKVIIKVKHGQRISSYVGTVYDYSGVDYKYYVVSFINNNHKEITFIINLTKFE